MSTWMNGMSSTQHAPGVSIFYPFSGEVVHRVLEKHESHLWEGVLFALVDRSAVKQSTGVFNRCVPGLPANVSRFGQRDSVCRCICWWWWSHCMYVMTLQLTGLASH